MGSLYKRGNTLWVAFKDQAGKRVCRSSGYKIGQEAAAEAVLAELNQKAAEPAAARPVHAEHVAPAPAPPAAPEAIAPALRTKPPAAMPDKPAARATLATLLRSTDNADTSNQHPSS